MSERIIWTQEERRLVYFRLFDSLGPELLDRGSDCWSKSAFIYSDGSDFKRTGRVLKAWKQAQVDVNLSPARRRTVLSIAETSYDTPGVSAKALLKEYLNGDRLAKPKVELPVEKPGKAYESSALEERILALEAVVQGLVKQASAHEVTIDELIGKLDPAAATVVNPEPPVQASQPVVKPQPIVLQSSVKEVTRKAVPKEVKPKEVKPAVQAQRPTIIRRKPSVKRLAVIGVPSNAQRSYQKKAKTYAGCKIDFIPPNYVCHGTPKSYDHYFLMIGHDGHAAGDQAKAIVRGDMSKITRISGSQSSFFISLDDYMAKVDV